jgi:hypothetical protein
MGHHFCETLLCYFDDYLGEDVTALGPNNRFAGFRGRVWAEMKEKEKELIKMGLESEGDESDDDPTDDVLDENMIKTIIPKTLGLKPSVFKTIFKKSSLTKLSDGKPEVTPPKRDTTPLKQQYSPHQAY